MVPASTWILLISLHTRGRLVMYIFYQLIPRCGFHQHNLLFFSSSLKKSLQTGEVPSSLERVPAVLPYRFQQGSDVCAWRRWNPQLCPTVSRSRSLVSEVGGCIKKQVYQWEIRRFGVSHFEPLPGIIEKQLLNEPWRQGKSDERKGDLTSIRPRRPHRNLGAHRFAHIHSWLTKCDCWGCERTIHEKS